MLALERELRATLGSNLERMKALIKKAESEKREFTAAEESVFKELDFETKRICDQLEIVYAGDRQKRVAELDAIVSAQSLNPFTPANFRGEERDPSSHSGEVWYDTEGREVRVYRPDQNFAAHAPHSEYGSLTVGSFLRAAILGPKSDAERRALAEGTDSSGGFTVPTALLPGFIDRLRAKSHVVRAGARTVDLNTGKSTTIARLASDVTAGWRSENAEITTADVTFEGVTFTPRSLGALLRCPRELAEDSLNLQEMLEASFAGAFAGEVDRAALLGSGTPPEPRGLKNITNVNAYSMGTNGAAISNYDPILEAIKLIDDDNGPEPTALILSPREALTVEKFKEATTNSPLSRPPRIQNLPFMVTSKIPVNETQGSANNASRIFLGEFSNLLIGVRQELRIEVLKERYAEFVQYGFLGTLRVDIAVTHPEVFSMVVGIITA